MKLFNHFYFKAGLIFLILPCFTLQAALKRSFEDEVRFFLQDARNQLNILKHETENNESEIRMFEEKLRNQDDTVEQLRTQLNNMTQNQRDMLKGASNNFEGRINSLDASVKGLIADFKQFKDYANETTSSLSQVHQRLSKLEKTVEFQNQNISNLENAIHALMEAMQIKEPSPQGSSDKSNSPVKFSGKTYKVKSGDSLGTIARDNQTTIQAIKELNNLSNDRIVIGQTLKLP